MNRALVVVAITALLRFAMAPLRRLSPDEAYYWCAARAGWPIGDHPPLLGAWLALADRFGGSIELRVRAVAIVGQAIAALGIGATAEALEARAFLPAVVLATWGLFPWAGGLVATPDVPLIASTAWLFAFAARRAGFVPLFAAAALCVASKASGLLVVAAIALGLGRRALPVVLGALLAAPLVARSLLLQTAHALGRGPLVFAPKVGPLLALVAFVGAALGLIGPAAIVLSVRARSELSRLHGGRGLVAVVALAMAASAIASGRPPEPNWIAPALVPLFAIAAVGFVRRDRRAQVLASIVHVAPALIAIALWLLPRDVGPLARVPKRGPPSRDVPSYGLAAWRCAHQARCEEIDAIFATWKLTKEASPQRFLDP